MSDPVEPIAAVDSDVDLHVVQQRLELQGTPLSLLGVIAAGGAAGALARYAASVLASPTVDGFPWATFGVNITGCFLVGVLMAWLARRPKRGPLPRLFLGVGVLGGFTTFSTYTVEAEQLLADRQVLLALVYLFGTLAAALVAVTTGLAVVRAPSRKAPRTGVSR
jgi:fluoride exporter